MKKISALFVSLASYVKEAYAAVARALDPNLAERRAREAYLSDCTSIEELETRDRTWDRTQDLQSKYFNGVR